ncbi:MFS transporter [Paenibacillus melissococcoides]|uniref:MFS transporter n=1 Tax=Paenibacillus melissococcoides TaxID=2912268 RepID=A0ABM9GAW9_9BACL|nr:MULTISPECIES: MDR family MFS transporter [Paenibacillus]MEB9892106.1 MDR family MFS transporter [Bacillus cereus]GIO76745.1 putative MFS-type transporter YusP [Paenibacillus dendritiformis]CAH8249259.1 MFS transporter [Paenibacillus melissococcoides]
MEHLSEKRKLTIMIAIMAAMFFSAINQTIIGVAMPRIIAKLGGMDYYTWAITIYLLTSTVATVLVGKLSDIFGRKPFILAGIALFMLGAFLSGFSADIFQLIAFRGIQGMGAGIIMSTAFTAVGDLYAPRERAKWMGVMSGVFGLSSVLGPPLGGYLVDHLDWRWVFWMFLPLGIIAFFMIIALFPKVERKKGESIDYWGSIFLTTTIVPLLLAFSWAGDGAGKYPWGSWQIIGLFSATLVSLIVFILVEMKVKSPVLPLSLFRNGIVTVSNLAGFVLNAGMMGAIIYVPFFVQGVKGISPTFSGYVTMPMSVVMILCTAFIGQFISKTGKYKKMAIAGLLIMTFGMVLLHFMTPETAIYITVIYMCIVGLGLGISMPVFSLTIQNAVEPKQLGVATASSQLFRSLGGTIGIAVMGTVMSSHMAGKMTELGAASGASGGQMQIDPKYAESIKEVMNPQTLLDQPKLEGIMTQLPPELQTMVDNLVHMVREALSYGVTSTFLTGAIVTAVAVVLTFFLKEIPLRSAKDVQVKQDGHAGEVRQQVVVNSKS